MTSRISSWYAISYVHPNVVVTYANVTYAAETFSGCDLDVVALPDSTVMYQINGVTTLDYTKETALGQDTRAKLIAAILALVNESLTVGDLHVTGDATIDGATTTGTLTVTGAATLAATSVTTLSASGASTLAAVTATSLGVTGSVDIDTDLNVDGTCNFDDVNIVGPVAITGTTTQTGDIALTGAIDASSTVESDYLITNNRSSAPSSTAGKPKIWSSDGTVAGTVANDLLMTTTTGTSLLAADVRYMETFADIGANIGIAAVAANYNQTVATLAIPEGTWIIGYTLGLSETSAGVCYCCLGPDSITGANNVRPGDAVMTTDVLEGSMGCSTTALTTYITKQVKYSVTSGTTNINLVVGATQAAANIVVRNFSAAVNPQNGNNRHVLWALRII